MPAYSKQLEDKDGNILYPITTAGSVVDEDGVDLQTRVEDAAYIGTGSVGTLSPWVDTSDLVDGAVTATKLDYTTNGATNIPANSDLNTASFITPGRYVCPSTADVLTLSNCPSSSAFSMMVINVLNAVKDISDTSLWMYFIRVLTDRFGGAFVQSVSNSGTITWTYSRWIRLSSDQTILSGSAAATINTTYINQPGDAQTIHRIGDLVVFNINVNVKSGTIPTGTALFSDLPMCGGTSWVACNMVGANGDGVRLRMQNGTTTLLTDGAFTSPGQWYNGQIVYMSY